MSDKMIESFLDYESKRSSFTNGNEFQAVKQLEERNNARTAAGGPATPAQVDAGAGRGYTGGPQADTPVSTTTLSDFPGITNTLNRVRSMGTLTPVNSIASAIGRAASAIRGSFTGDGESSTTFPTKKALEGSSADVTASATRPEPSRIVAPDTALTRRPESRPETPVSDSKPNEGNDKISAPTVRTSTGRQGASSSYTIKSGDTLSQIAQRNNLSVRDLMSANPDIEDANRINVGQNLRIPTSVASRGKNIYAGGVGAGGPRPTNESVEFSEEELAHFNSVMEAMPVAPTPADHAPNPTPTKKAEGGKGRGSLSEKMDPVGAEDEDVDNDGKVDKSDKYLKNRRRVIAMKMKEK